MPKIINVTVVFDPFHLNHKSKIATKMVTILRLYCGFKKRKRKKQTNLDQIRKLTTTEKQRGKR